MTIKNILVAKNYTVTDHTKWYNNRSNETGLVEDYHRMEQLMTESAKRFVTGLDDIVIHRGSAENIREVFRDHFGVIYHLWKTGANILYVDLDVLFVKPYDIFGKVDHFAMFNHTSPPKTKDLHYDVNFPNYFNCGIRYYPATMRQQYWDIGFGMIENWNPDRWDTEQVIYNHMLWSQDISLEETLKPEMAYQYIHDTDKANDVFNEIPINTACAIHFHSSRGSRVRCNNMRRFCSGTSNAQL